MQTSKLVVREAERADAPALMALVHELAEYERLAHEVVGNAELLARHLFDAPVAAYALVGEVDGTVAGFALYYTTYSTFLTRPGLHLEDLFVRPAYRGSGLGRALLSRLAATAVRRGDGRLEWSVLDWNESAIAFYHARGAAPMEGWTVYRVTGEALEQLAAEAR